MIESLVLPLCNINAHNVQRFFFKSLLSFMEAYAMSLPCMEGF